MKIIVADTYDEMSRLATHKLLATMLKSGRVNMAITAGNTPKGVYQLLVDEVADVIIMRTFIFTTLMKCRSTVSLKV